MDLQQSYDMFVVPAVNKARREIDSGKSFIDNLGQLEMDTLPLVRERRNAIKAVIGRLDGIDLGMKLDPIPQWLKSKSLEVQEQRLSKIEAKITALDHEIELIMTKENTQRECLLQEALNTYNRDMKPIRDLAQVRQNVIDQGFEVVWSSQGYAPSIDEYMDVSGLTVDECYDILVDAPMPKDSGFKEVVSPYEYCVNNVAVSCAALIVFILIALTPLFNILAIGAIGAAVVLCAKQLILQKRICLVFSILSGFDLSQFNKEFEAPPGTRPLTVEDIDSSPLFEGFEERYIALEEEAGVEDTNEYDYLLQEFEIRKSELQRQLDNEISALTQDKEKVLKTLVEAIEECDVKEQEIIASFQQVGERRADNLIYAHNISLGFHDGEDEILNAEGTNLLFSHTIVQEDKQNLAKILVANLFSTLKLGLFNLFVYDPHTYGAPVMAMYNEKLYNAITFEQDNIDNIMNNIQKASKRMYELSGGRPISEYNKMAGELEKVPATYNFVMILSDVESFTKSEQYLKFAESAHLAGTYFWVFADKPVDTKKMANFKVITNPYPNIEHPMRLDIQQCNRFAESYGYDLEKNNKPKGLKWKDFINNICPVDKIWSWIADNEVKLCPGYTDGDPGKVPMFELGNTGNVHGLAAGATGSGKSVFLNHLITTLCMMYPPTELLLCLCDFKGSEFGKYIDPEGTNKILPHIMACLCTADGDYAASLFEGIEKLGKARYALMQKPAEHLDEIKYFPEGEEVPPAVDGAKAWNRYWKRKADQTGDQNYRKNVFPRILTIVDEFQNIFQSAEQEAIDILVRACTWLGKVGRAANVNVLFSSQTLTGTLSDDLLSQMTLRFALRCTKELSNTLLGTPNAGTIKYSYGFLYATATGIPEDNQPFIKTPYLADYIADKQLGDVAESINLLNDKLEELPWYEPQDVVTYLEVTKHPVEQIDEMFAEHRDKFPDAGLFFLGAPMTYSTNKVHGNFVLARKNNTHIVSCFGDNTDFVLFFKQCVRCIQNHLGPKSVVVNSQVQDMAYLCDAEDYVSEPEYKLLLNKAATPKVALQFLKQIFTRRANIPNEECVPVYAFLLAWDKGVGIGIEPDYDTRAELVNFLQVCGEKNIHIIFINQAMNGFTDAVVSACKYRLAGKCSFDDSCAVIGTKHASKYFESMPTGWVFSFIDGKLEKSKLYTSPITKFIEQDRVVI